MSSVTPVVGMTTSITVGGTAEQVFPPKINGGIITNPYSASEVLYVDAVNAASLSASATTFALQPGQTWEGIPGQTTQTTVNAASSGHTFSAIYW
jgi:hypothetical protein